MTNLFRDDLGRQRSEGRRVKSEAGQIPPSSFSEPEVSYSLCFVLFSAIVMGVKVRTKKQHSNLTQFDEFLNSSPSGSHHESFTPFLCWTVPK